MFEQLTLEGMGLPTAPALQTRPPPSAGPAHPPATAHKPISSSHLPPAQAGHALPALETPWQHPQTNRQAVLEGRKVGFVFRRGQRRTIGFGINSLGLTVSAPRWVTLSAVDEALQSKAAWVVRKLAQVGTHHEVMQAARLVWADGLSLAWLGSTVTVRLGAPAVRRGMPLVTQADGSLWAALPPTATPEQLRDAVQAWMMRAAHAHFVQRLDWFAPLLGVKWTSLRLSGATTRWGSAKADGSIRLHWRLMQFSPEVVDYVVAHELSHLRHMDHSDRFWQTVASVVPDFAALRAQLKGERLPPW
jgi:predicted metal-dependent hydrolase